MPSSVRRHPPSTRAEAGGPRGGGALQAARRLGIQPDTFRRANHEGILILELAMRIYGLMNGGIGSPHEKPLPTGDDQEG